MCCRIVAEFREFLVEFGELLLFIQRIFAAFQDLFHFLQSFPASGVPILRQVTVKFPDVQSVGNSLAYRTRSFSAEESFVICSS